MARGLAGDCPKEAIILNISIKGGRLFEGGRRFTEGRLLFEEIRYIKNYLTPSPPGGGGGGL